MIKKNEDKGVLNVDVQAQLGESISSPFNLVVSFSMGRSLNKKGSKITRKGKSKV